MLLTRLLYASLPSDRRIALIVRMLCGNERGGELLFRYVRWHDRLRARVARWHRERLIEIDDDFRMLDAQFRLIRAREAARERGVKPLDPEYPDIDQFLFPKK